LADFVVRYMGLGGMGNGLAMTSDQPSRQSLEELADAERNKEKLVVLAQPHRLGDSGEMVGAFGSFIKHFFADITEQNTGRRCWEAGRIYTLLIAKWRRAKGIPQTWLMDEKGEGGELDNGVIEEWGRRIAECENAMKCSGVAGFRAARNLVLEDVPQPEKLFGPVKRALTQLGILLIFGKHLTRGEK
jgi:hypothetical protein